MDKAWTISVNVQCTLIKKKIKFPRKSGNLDGSGCKVINEEVLPEEMRKYIGGGRLNFLIYEKNLIFFF